MDADNIWDAFDGRPHRVAMGLMPLDPTAWVTLPNPGALAGELDRKATLLTTMTEDVLALLPGHEALAACLLDALLGNLATHHSGRYRVTDTALTLRDDGRTWDRREYRPLDLAGRIVTEDWCLVAGGKLVGATLCSPNRWRLREKLGLPIASVHAPVPGYAPAIGEQVDRLLRRPGRPLWRQNWSIHPSRTLYQPFRDGPSQPRIPTDLWVRSERETLVPLPGGWAFGIRTRICPLADLPPGVATRVRTAVQTLDPASAAYREMTTFRTQLLEWLATRITTPSGGTEDGVASAG